MQTQNHVHTRNRDLEYIVSSSGISVYAWTMVNLLLITKVN